MCGHVGVAGDLTTTSLKIMNQLLIADQFRGMHSTGIASIKKGVAGVYKRAITASDFVHLPAPNRMVDQYCDAIIGHNRHATVGTITDANAHPFQHGEITLAHNGTLTSRYGLPDHTRFGVDSENICWAMTQWEAQPVLEELNGAYALVWHDSRDNTLNFARNDQRELCLAVANGVLYWASEALMLEWILERNKIYKPDFLDLPTGKMYQLSLSEKLKSFNDFEVFDFTPKKPVVYSGYNNGYGGRRQQGQNTHNTAKKDKEDRALKLKKLGYEIDQEVEFFADGFVPYGNDKTRGNLFGFDIEGGARVVVMGVSRNEIVFKKGDPDKVSMEVVYSSFATNVTRIGFPQDREGTYVGLAVKDIQFEDLDPKSPGDDIIHYWMQFGDDEEEEDSTEKKQSSPSIDEGEDPYQDMLVDGTTVKGREVPKILDEGCSWCGNPLSLDALRRAKVTENGEFVHKEQCWIEYVAYINAEDIA